MEVLCWDSQDEKTRDNQPHLTSDLYGKVVTQRGAGHCPQLQFPNGSTEVLHKGNEARYKNR